MQRYLSHYTYIHPDIHLVNHIVEIDEKGLVQYYPYEKQLSGTTFVSGLLILLPSGVGLSDVSRQLSVNETYAGLIERGSMLVRSFPV